MTAINVILQRDAAHLITDGAAFGDSAMLWQSAKAFPLPHLGAVVAVTGAPAYAPLFAAVLSMAAENFDALKVLAPAALQGAQRTYAGLLQQAPDARFAVVVAGLSGADEPEAYLVTNDARLCEPWTVQPLGPVAMILGDAETHARFAEAYPDITSGDELDPERDGLRMLDSQRRRPSHGIGGFAQLTTMTAAGISMRIIHRWASTPDLGAADAA